VGGGGGGLGEVTDKNTVEVGAGGLEGEATQNRVIQAGEFEPREVGRAIKGRFENG
jgi:hypothetical protein